MNEQPINTYRVVSTGKKIKARLISRHEYENVVTGEIYSPLELEIHERRTYWQICGHVWRFGIAIYFHDQSKYRRFQTPAIAIEYINGIDFFVDLQFCFLCYITAIRFIFIKNK